MRLNPEVLAAFGLEGQDAHLVAQRENCVYRVGDWAVRAHRPGYRTRSQIEAELAFMDALFQAGCQVPQTGAVHAVQGRIYSSVRWLEGQTFADQAPVPLDGYQALGRLLKRCQRVALPPLDRPIWDMEAIVGPSPLWGRWQDCGGLTRTHLALFRTLQPRTPLPPLQLIHADALRENVLLIGAHPALIDFDDCAYGYPSFDVATTLVKEWDSPRFTDIKAAVLEGYGPIDAHELDLMLALRALTYVGWVEDRVHEPGMAARAGPALARAVHFARLFEAGA